MRIHCIFHETFEGLGCIKSWIKQKGHQVTETRTFLFEPYPETDDFDWLIIMGGALSINEEDKFPWLKIEKNFIHRTIDADKIVLGICFGAQLIAEALGSKIYKNKYQEIGWFPVKIHKNNLPSELKSIPESLTVFHWHGDTFDLPQNVIHIAESVATPNQAFLYKEKVLALQFHFEMDEKAINMMLDHTGNKLLKDRYVQLVDEIVAGKQYIEKNNRIMFMILDYLEGSMKG